MADTPRRAPRELRSWRAQPENERTSPMVRRVQRVVVSLVVIALIAAMVYVLVPRHRATTHIAYLPVREYGVLKADALPESVFSPAMLEHFELQTLAAPSSMAPMQTSNFFLPREAPDADGQIESSFGAGVRELTGYGDDAVVVYVSAHGVSLDGEAYLLMGDFDPRRQNVGLSPIDEVLDGVSRSAAGRKLLILDAGQIVSDPRLGMLINEFPQLLDEAVRQHDDSDLWVLCSHWMLETSHVAYSLRRTVFSEFVSRGLSGEADRDEGPEPQVDLRELFAYVSINVPDWVRRTRGPAASQTPVLMRGGRGQVRTAGDVPTIAIMPVLPPPEPTEPKADATEAAQIQREAGPMHNMAQAGWLPSQLAVTSLFSADEPPAETAPDSEAAPSTPSEPAGETAPAATPTPPATEPDPAATPTPPAGDAPAEAPPAGDGEQPAEVDPLRKQLRRLLDEAWQLRDLAQSKPRGGVGRRGAPVDFAPHLWREFQERIYGYELQYRYGLSSEYLMAGLRENVLPLRQVVERGQLDAVDSRSLVRPLAKEWMDYQQQFGPGESERDVAIVERALTSKNDTFDRAAYFVRWYSQAALLAPGGEPRFNDVGELLVALNSLASLLESGVGDASRPLNVQQLRDQLDRLGDLEQRVQASTPSAAENSPLGSVECYLATPLPDAAARGQLMDHLFESATLENDVFDELTRYSDQRTLNPGDPIGPSPINTNAWERIGQIAQLELALARLALPSLASTSQEMQQQRTVDTLATAVDEFLKTLGVSNGSEGSGQPAADAVAVPEADAADAPRGADRWTLAREIGGLLRTFYDSLPGEIAIQIDRSREEDQLGGTAASEASRVAADRLYRLVDARDAASPLIPSFVPHMPRADSLSVETELVLEASASPLALDPQRGATPLSLIARARTGRPSDAWLVLSYDASLLEVRDDGSCVHQSGSLAASRVKEHPPTFSFARGQDRIHQVELLVRAKSAATSSNSSSESPRLEAHLYFVEDDGSVQGPITHRVPIRLPVPDVDLVLTGPQEEQRLGEQTVTVLRPFPNQATEFGWQLHNRGNEEQEVSLELIAVPPSLGTQWPKQWPVDELGELKPGLRKLLVAEARQTVAPGATVPVAWPVYPPKPADDAPADAEAEALPPPPDMTYGLVAVLTDQAGRRAVRYFDLSPQRPSDYLSVDVSWSQDREHRVQIDVAPRSNNADTLPPQGSKVTWDWELAGIPPDAARADAGEIKPPDSRQARLYADVPESRSSALTVQLDVDGVGRAFIYEITPGQPGRPKRNLQRVVITEPAQDGQAIRAPRETMTVSFFVDAPADAFRTAQRELDFVEIGLVDPQGEQQRYLQQPIRFHSDRQHQAVLAASTPEGRLAVQTTVGDFTVELDTLRKSNEMVGVLARFEFDRREVYDLRTVLLDASAPQIVEMGTIERGALPEIQGTVGQDLNLYARLEDRGAVEKVEFFLVPTSFDVETNWQFDDQLAQPPLLASPRSERWTAKLPTGELKPGRYLLLARATDQAGLRNKATLPMEISAPAAPGSPANPEPEFSDLVGVVTAGGRPTLGMTVSLVDQGRPAVRTGSDGQFAFAKLPPGDYQVRVQGSVRNQLVDRTVDVTLPRRRPLAISFD